MVEWCRAWCLDKLHLKCGEASFLFWLGTTSCRMSRDPIILPQRKQDSRKHRDSRTTTPKIQSTNPNTKCCVRWYRVFIVQMDYATKGARRICSLVVCENLAPILHISSQPERPSSNVVVYLHELAVFQPQECSACIRSSNYPPCQALQ